MRVVYGFTGCRGDGVPYLVDVYFAGLPDELYVGVLPDDVKAGGLGAVNGACPEAAGGIGMSALIRYFLSKGKFVAGYDRTPSELTGHLIAEGAQIHYEENTGLIPEICKDKESTLVVYNPAIPQEHAELVYFRENGFEIHKRSQVLGTITRSSKGLCVAGTHGNDGCRVGQCQSGDVVAQFFQFITVFYRIQCCGQEFLFGFRVLYVDGGVFIDERQCVLGLVVSA